MVKRKKSIYSRHWYTSGSACTFGSIKDPCHQDRLTKGKQGLRLVRENERELLSIRAGIRPYYILNICRYHEASLLNFYSFKARKCCNPLSLHSYAKRKALKNVTLNFYKKVKHILTTNDVLPGKKVCGRCYRALLLKIQPVDHKQVVKDAAPSVTPQLEEDPIRKTRSMTRLGRAAAASLARLESSVDIKMELSIKEEPVSDADDEGNINEYIPTSQYFCKTEESSVFPNNSFVSDEQALSNGQLCENYDSSVGLPVFNRENNMDFLPTTTCSSAHASISKDGGFAESLKRNSGFCEVDRRSIQYENSPISGMQQHIHERFQTVTSISKLKPHVSNEPETRSTSVLRDLLISSTFPLPSTTSDSNSVTTESPAPRMCTCDAVLGNTSAIHICKLSHLCNCSCSFPHKIS